jgi:hypothetical protein
MASKPKLRKPVQPGRINETKAAEVIARGTVSDDALGEMFWPWEESNPKIIKQVVLRLPEPLKEKFTYVNTRFGRENHAVLLERVERYVAENLESAKRLDPRLLFQQGNGEREP